MKTGYYVAMQYSENISYAKRLKLYWASQPELIIHIKDTSDCCRTVRLACLFNLPLGEQWNNQPYLPWIPMKSAFTTLANS